MIHGFMDMNHKFESATPFGSTFETLDDILEKNNKPIMMYCTGGI